MKWGQTSHNCGMDGREPTDPHSVARLPMADLVELALDDIAREDDEPVRYLVALHDRPTREVFEVAAGLLAADDSRRRELGARILRELGPEVDGRRPFSVETNDLLLS